MKLPILFTRNLIYVLSLGIVLSACKKDEILPDSLDPISNPAGTNSVLGSGTLVTTSVGGKVLDLLDQPVENATVVIGTNTATTNSFGMFNFTNIEVDSDRAYIQVEKDGYFHGSTTINVEVGVPALTKITLIAKNSPSIFSSNTGAMVTPGLASFNFEPGDIALANGDPYNGTVMLYSSYLDPTSPGTSDAMPGDLLAVDASNNIVFLETYGMIAVELVGQNGEELNVAPGQTVEFTMPINTDQFATAPSTIPLWHFDETVGNWVEEGSATKQGSVYLCEVSHFTYWNCDDPYSTVDWTVTFESNGSPLSHVSVQLVNSVTGSVFGSSYTNPSGQITDPIPAGLPLRMNVFSSCGALIHTQDLGEVTSFLDLGTIIINDPNSSTLSAVVVDCNNQPVPNGIVYTTGSGISELFYADNNGVVDASFIHCGQSTLNLLPINPINSIQGSSSNVAVSSAINADSLFACSIFDEFVNYTLDGTNYSFVTSDYIDASFNSGPPNLFTIGAQDVSSNGILFGFIANTAGSFTNADPQSGQVLSKIEQAGIPFYIPATSFNVNITQYADNVGDYFEGTFGGSFYDTMTVPHNINGTFRVMRSQ